MTELADYRLRYTRLLHCVADYVYIYFAIISVPIVFARSESLFTALVLVRCHALRISLYINPVSTITAHSISRIRYYFDFVLLRFRDSDFTSIIYRFSISISNLPILQQNLSKNTNLCKIKFNIISCFQLEDAINYSIDLSKTRY